jgi:hypothetical protein
METGSDGIRRFVLVDLPERGDQIPATVVDAYLLRALHYVFLRHRDASVGPLMGQAAHAMIGNESLFDLKFDTSRVLAMRGQPLEDARIHTYCAGFLVLCAMQTPHPLDEFFPIHEKVAEGNTAANLERIGLAIGEDFISPTGALFSPGMEIAAQSQPMYDPGRQIQEAIYDRFADGMRHRRLDPSPNALQRLREELAALSQASPWLTRALARANRVNEQLDLESAARTATVIEILDEIADTHVQAFAQANQAILAEGYGLPPEGGSSEEERIRRQALLAQHADLVQRWTAGSLTPRQLRAELVDFYVSQGNQQVDQRFFAE